MKSTETKTYRSYLQKSKIPQSSLKHLALPIIIVYWNSKDTRLQL
jgi:hypothetical protein